VIENGMGWNGKERMYILAGFFFAKEKLGEGRE